MEQPDWLSDWRTRGLQQDQALEVFDALPPIAMKELLGTWTGAGLHSGHKLDGILEALGWYGKEFRSADDVDPLLFRRKGGKIRPLDPALMPVKSALRFPGLAGSKVARTLLSVALPCFSVRRPTARLREMIHRGVASTAMIYDRQPIIDHFRIVNDGRILGLMDMRWSDRPFFFLLTRTNP